MQTLQNCSICNSPLQVPFLECKDFTVSRETFKIVACGKCGFRYTNPRPEEEKLGAYYESEDYISHSNTTKGIINRLYQSVRKITIRRKVKLIGALAQKGEVLDIGCGTGEFLIACKTSGWNTIGIEPSNQAREYAQTQFNLSVYDQEMIKELKDHSFDIITMWHVLEHVPRLNERIDELKRLLKQSGTIIVAVPNCSSFDAKKYGKFWAAYDVPRHLYHFQPANIEQLFGRYGMKVIKTLPMKFDSFYVSLLSEKYKFGKPNLFRAIWVGMLSNILGAFGKNIYSSQIYIIRKT